MSEDFLSQFSQKNYSRTENTGTAASASGAMYPVSAVSSVPSAGITAPEHDTEIDNTYNKRKLIRYGIIAGTIIAVAVLIYLMVSLFNQVTVKNFVGTSINDAKTWGITSKISIETETVF
ncbi:MAG: hypothetical protein FWF88_10170, partial [Peptococcaceae bacterium]|nr:hypothetical protein [Peptococcaceae bacterium]